MNLEIEQRADDVYSYEEESKNHTYRTYTPADVTLIKKVAYVKGAKDEHKLLTEWREIEADEDGFATARAIDKMLESLPVLIQEEYYGVYSYYVINAGGSFTEWASDLYHKPNEYKWRPIH